MKSCKHAASSRFSGRLVTVAGLWIAAAFVIAGCSSTPASGSAASKGSSGVAAAQTSAVKLSITSPLPGFTVRELPLGVSAQVSGGAATNPGMEAGAWPAGSPESDQPSYTVESSALSADMTLEGLTNSAEYDVRVRAVVASGGSKSYGVWSAPARVTLALAFSAPEATEPPAGGMSIETRPTIRWSYEGRATSYDFELSGRSLSTPITATGLKSPEYALGQSLQPGSYQYRVRALDSSGIWTGWSSYAAFTVNPDAVPEPTTLKGGETSIALRPVIGWTPLLGAAGYTLEVSRSGNFSGPPIAAAKVERGSSFRMPNPLQPGTLYYYRVRAVNKDGTALRWSPTASFAVADLGFRFVPVVQPGHPVQFAMGDTGGSFDAAPVHPVKLTVPYEMQVYELTNVQAARLLNWAVDHGYASLEAQADGGMLYTTYAVQGSTNPSQELASASNTADAGGVAASRPVESTTAAGPAAATAKGAGARVAGFGSLNYGTQFGLRIENGRVAPVRGRENQPVIGVTWDGALLLANCLSILEGRTPAYDLASRRWKHTADGFRLPTEAEWEFAMRGTDGRIFAWGNTAAGNLANYYRSYDPYEAVNPPYTENGGPLTPVSFFDGAVHDGFATRSNASPFNVFDLCGNVWEWCWDIYASDTYAVDAAGVTDPSGPGTGPERVTRGGAWNVPLDFFRGTNRGHYPADGTSYSTGIRFVADLAQPLAK